MSRRKFASGDIPRVMSPVRYIATVAGALAIAALSWSHVHSQISNPGVQQSGAVSANDCVKWGPGVGQIQSTGAGCAASYTPAALTKADDTNITLTLTGTPATALLQSVQIAAGWTGTLAAARLNADVVQGVTNDTNITGVIAAQNLTLGWAGTLAAARLNADVVQSVVNDTNVTGSIAAQALTLGWAGTLDVSRGGTGISSGTSGGVPYFSTAGTIASSAALAANQIVLGGGAGNPPATLGSLGTTTSVLHGNAAGAPSFGAVVSADLNITTTSCTNQFVTAISAGGVGTCTTPTLAGAQFANQGTTTTVLHGNAAGNPSFGQIVAGDIATGAITSYSALTFNSGNAANPCLQGSTWFFSNSQCYASENNAAFEIPMAGVIDKLRCSTATAPGGAAQTFVMTLRRNAADTSLTCTMTTGGATDCGDASNTVTVAANDRLAIKMVTSATSGTAIMNCAVRYKTVSP